MIKLFKIIYWEFKSKVSSKSFVFSTLVSPLIFTLIIYIPSYHFTVKQDETFRIGFIDATDLSLYTTFDERLQQSKESKILLSRINADSSGFYQHAKMNRDTLAKNLSISDSLYRHYQKLRKYTFLKKKLKKEKQQALLQNYYTHLIRNKEKRRFYRKELKQADTELEEAFITGAKSFANNLLKNKEIDAYLYLPPNVLTNEDIEYHSLRPGHFLLKEKFKEILDNIILQKRLVKARIETRKSEKILKPVIFNTYQIKGDEVEKSDTFANYYGPIIALFLLFLSVFTSSGHLFSSLVNEKNKRILEFLLGSCSKHQFFFSKIVGVGLLGLFQIFVWLGIFLIVLEFELFKLENISYLNWTNFLYFLIYYLMAYLLFSTLLAGISVIFVSEHEANNLNQSIRVIAILPILFALFVLENPNSEFIRLLSFIPFLSPSFMIMRIPLSSDIPVHDIQQTIIILSISIIVFYFLSYRLFKAASVYYGKRPSFFEVFSIIKNGQI